jgi:hypothetical protein
MPDRVVTVRVDRATGQPAGDDPCGEGTEQEGAGLAPGHAAHLVEEVARLTPVEPAGQRVRLRRRLLREVGGETQLAALTVGHPVQLVSQRAETAARLVLLSLGLLVRLLPDLTGEVAGLLLALVQDVLALLGRGPGHLLAGLLGGLADLCGLVLRGVRGARPAQGAVGGRQAAVRCVGHDAAPSDWSVIRLPAV